MLTRANGTHSSDYWFNIGTFPLAGATGPEGPQGPQGEQGNQGETGPEALTFTESISIATIDIDVNVTLPLTNFNHTPEIGNTVLIPLREIATHLYALGIVEITAVGDTNATGVINEYMPLPKGEQGEQGEPGPKGDTGADVLVVKPILNMTSAVMGTTITLNNVLANFNRTPVVGDSALAVFYVPNATPVYTYIGKFDVTNVSQGGQSTLTLKTSQSIIGPQGQQGPQGPQGNPGPTGAQGPIGLEYWPVVYNGSTEPSSVVRASFSSFNRHPSTLFDYYTKVLMYWLDTTTGKYYHAVYNITDINASLESVSMSLFESVEINFGGGGSGAVDSVNGQTGVVVLTASDINATNTQSIQANLERIDGEVESVIDSLADKQDAITSIELNGATTNTVTYDSTEGINIVGTGEINSTDTISTEFNIPIIPGTGINIDATSGNDAVEIKVDPDVLDAKQDALTAGANITITSNNVISATAGISIQVYTSVEELPTVGESNVFYLVATSAAVDNYYDEYIWLTTDQVYEKIGSTEVDLSQYVRNTDYASSSTGGVIKVSNTYGFSINSANGVLTTTEKTAEGFDSALNNCAISKGTLNNVIADRLATKTELSAKANDNAVVHLSGNETIAGTKTFTSEPSVKGLRSTGSLHLINSSNEEVFSVAADSNGGMEFGPSNTATARTPFIDFHTGRTNNDFDVRLLAKNGVIGTPGKGILDITADQVNLNGSPLLTTAVVSGKANLSGGNEFSGQQVFKTSAGTPASEIYFSSNKIHIKDGNLGSDYNSELAYSGITFRDKYDGGQGTFTKYENGQIWYQSEVDGVYSQRTARLPKTSNGGTLA